jgi:hypothetical protein
MSARRKIRTDRRNRAISDALQVAALLLPWVLVARFADALRWVRACHLSAKGDFEEALTLARRVRTTFKKRIDWRLFEIQQLTLLQRDQEAVEAVNGFLLDHQYPTPPTANRAYLLMFAKWCGQTASARYGYDSPVPSALLFDASTIALRAVDNRYKRMFPLSIHPAWSPSSPFHESQSFLGDPRPQNKRSDAQSKPLERRSST